MPRDKRSPWAKNLPKYASMSSVKKIINKRERAGYLYLNYHFRVSDLSAYYGIPASSIRRAAAALKSHRKVGRSGRPTAIPDSGESALVDTIINAFDQFDFLSVSEARELLEKRDTKSTLGSCFILPKPSLTYGWVESFIKRHADIIHKGWIEYMV